MILYFVLYLVLQTSVCNGGTTKMAAVTKMAPKLDRNIYKKTAELLHLINKIHSEKDDGSKQKSGNNVDYFSERNNQEMALKPLLKLLQKNYDASNQYTELPEVRVHYISNPEVLEQFKDIIKKKHKYGSYEEYSQSDPDNKLKEILSNLRRQAVFRIDDPASEEKTVMDTQNAEAAELSAEKNKENQANYEENIGNSRKKDTESKEQGDNAWDVITKKYDWEENAKKDWGGKETNISGDEKKKSKKVDNWVDGGQDKKKDDWNDWGQKKDKNDKWDDADQDKKKDNWNDWDQKKDKKEKAPILDEWKNNDKIEEKWDDLGQKKKKENWDDWDQKKDKKKKAPILDKWQNNDKIDEKWDDLGKKKKKENWDEWGQKKSEPLDTWGDSKPKKKKERIEVKWDEPKHRKGSEVKEKKEKSEWDTKWKKNDNWDNWENTTQQKRKTTKRKSQVTMKKINEWENYVPKVHNKPKRHEFERNVPAGAFGRTSIPFVGKKGIYEDK